MIVHLPIDKLHAGDNYSGKVQQPAKSKVTMQDLKSLSEIKE